MGAARSAPEPTNEISEIPRWSAQTEQNAVASGGPKGRIDRRVQSVKVCSDWGFLEEISIKEMLS